MPQANTGLPERIHVHTCTLTHTHSLHNNWVTRPQIMRSPCRALPSVIQHTGYNIWGSSLIKTLSNIMNNRNIFFLFSAVANPFLHHAASFNPNILSYPPLSQHPLKACVTLPSFCVLYVHKSTVHSDTAAVCMQALDRFEEIHYHCSDNSFRSITYLLAPLHICLYNAHILLYLFALRALLNTWAEPHQP